MDIEAIRALCTDETIMITQHMSMRLRERGITYKNIKQAILNGEIIEQYPEDYPYPSCLILGWADLSKGLHVVCGIGNGMLWIITAYWPNPDKWDANLKVRKDGKS